MGMLLSRLEEALDVKFEKEVVKKSYQGEIKEGSPVYHIRLRQKGKLVSYDPEKKKALISIGNIRGANQTLGPIKCAKYFTTPFSLIPSKPSLDVI